MLNYRILFAVDDIALVTVGARVEEWIGNHGLNIAVIVLGAWLLKRFGAQIISQLLRHTIRPDLYPTKADREKRLKTLSSLVGASIGIIIYIVAGIMIIGELGVNTAPLIASAGILGVALGFGAQSLIKDFVSGIFIIIENQYRVSDEVQLGSVSGVVEAITIRTTVLRDLNGHVHHVPNGTITFTTNKTMDFGRINEDIEVAMDTDLDRLEHIINHVGQEIAALPEFKRHIHEAPHLASFRGFSSTGFRVKILGKTSANEHWRIRSELYKRLKDAFEQHKIKVTGQPVLPPATTK